VIIIEEMKNIVQKVAVGALILKDNKILILQRAADDSLPGLWELPSGKKEQLENAEDALVRESKEEAGLNVNVIKPVAVFNYKMEKESEIRDVTQINFLCTPTNDSDVQLSIEHQNFAWVNPDQLNNYNLSKETKEAILKAFEINN
jgi:8-oxo-dGTP diphosphatase